MTVVAFTGHRPDKLGGYEDNPLQDWVKAKLREELTQIQPKRCITGMALGVDTWGAEICIDYDIPFTAALPFPGQELRWPTISRVRYRQILDKAAEVVFVMKKYHRQAFQTRNIWMVNRADIVLSVWDGSPGGTGNCCRYADDVKKPRINIDPRNFE